MGVAIRNKTPQTFNDVLIEITTTIPQNVRVTSTKTNLGTFEWQRHTLHTTHVIGKGQWKINSLSGYARARLSFIVGFNAPIVGDEVLVEAKIVSSHPEALSVEQTKTVTIVK